MDGIQQYPTNAKATFNGSRDHRKGAHVSRTDRRYSLAQAKRDGADTWRDPVTGKDYVLKYETAYFHPTFSSPMDETVCTDVVDAESIFALDDERLEAWVEEQEEVYEATLLAEDAQLRRMGVL